MNKHHSILFNKNYISTGNLFLDKIVSGLSIGTIVLFIEDSPTKLNEVFLKYLISEGLVNKDYIFFMYSNSRSLDILNTLPYKSTAVESILNSKKGSDNKSGEIKIAWRYENIKYSNILEDLAKTSNYILDLSRHLQEEYYSEKSSNLVKIEIFPSNDPKKILSQINNNIVKRYSNIYGNVEEDAQKKIVKFIIPNILEYCSISSVNNKDQMENNIKIQLQVLKNLARSINGNVFISISNEELINSQYLNLFKYFSDYVFTIKSFLLIPQKLEDYDGLLTINKIPRLLSLKSIEIETDTYGLILEKKKLIIEKIDIGPEIDRNTKLKEKDVNDITASQAMCSSKHSKDYEF